jgi:hypothetical protein
MQILLIAEIGNSVGVALPRGVGEKLSRIDRVLFTGTVTSLAVTVPGIGNRVAV